MRLVAVFLARRGIRVLHFRVDAKYENGLVHRRQRGGECSLASVSPLLIFAKEKNVDGEGDAGSESKQRVDMRACLQLRWICGNHQHAKPSIARNQRNSDRGLRRDSIRVMSFLSQIFNEGRLFLRPGDADRAPLDRW